MKESQLRCIKLLEDENMALRAQLKEIHGAVAKLMRQKTDGSKDLPFFSEAYLYDKLGKDDARTVLYGFERIVNLCYLDETGAAAVLKLNRAFEELYQATYDLHVLNVEGVPEKPEPPRSPHFDVRYKDQTPEQRAKVDAFFASKKWRDYSKAQQDWCDNPNVRKNQKLVSINERRRVVEGAMRAVRECVAVASMERLTEKMENQ